MRRDPDFFADPEIPLLYMAKRLREALKVEKLLTDAEVDYLVETGPYTGGLLIRRDLTGAFFYVAPADLARAQQILRDNRYRPYEQD